MTISTSQASAPRRTNTLSNRDTIVARPQAAEFPGGFACRAVGNPHGAG